MFTIKRGKAVSKKFEERGLYSPLLLFIPNNMQGKTYHIDNPSPALLRLVERLRQRQEENRARLQAVAKEIFAKDH